MTMKIMAKFVGNALKYPQAQRFFHSDKMRWISTQRIVALIQFSHRNRKLRWKSIQFDARHLLSNWFSAETVLMASPLRMSTHRVSRWSRTALLSKNCHNNTTNVATEMNEFSGCDCPCARWTHRKLHQIIACANFRRMDCSNKNKTNDV